MTIRALSPRFFSLLAHDLRSPLNVVSSALTELAREPNALPADERALMFTLSQRAISRLVGLTQRLSLAAKIETDDLDFQPTVVDLGAVVKETLATFTATELRKRVEATCTVPDAPVRVNGDVTLLKALLRELLANANQHARRKLRVEVTGGIVSIDDDGDGIREEERPLMFEPFVERANRTGLGFGLWLARTLAQKHEGSLTVEQLPSGTRQSLTLPVLP